MPVVELWYGFYVISVDYAWHVAKGIKKRKISMDRTHKHQFPRKWTFVGIFRGNKQYAKVCTVNDCLECLTKYEPIKDQTPPGNSWSQSKKENENDAI